MAARPLNIAVLGFGGRAESLTAYVHEHPGEYIVRAIAEPDKARRARAAELFGQAKMFESGEAFYASGLPVDGVWVISKEKTHAALAIPALERRLPLICEKPLATTLEDCYRICAAYEKNPVPVVIPHSLRYLPTYRKVREFVVSGRLGRILHIHAVEAIDDRHTVGYYRRGPGRLRADTTFLLAKSSHDLDIVNWMMNGVKARSIACFGGQDFFKPRPEVPDRCTDRCRELRTCPHGPYGKQVVAGEAVRIDPDTEAVFDARMCAWNSGGEQVDHQTLIIQYEDGTTVDFTLRAFGGGGRYLQITGSSGSVISAREVRLLTYHPSSDRIIPPEELPPVPQGPHGGGDWALLRDWYEAVTTGRPPNSASVHESAEAVALCLAADEAMLKRSVLDMGEFRERARRNLGTG
jgi:predicted dehydrogenase